MYYINKIVGFLVSPIGGAIAGGVLALLCAKRGRLRAAKWIGGITVAWLWLWMTPIMTWVVGVPLEREFLVGGRVPAVETFPETDAIILLGGGMSADTNHNSYAEMSAGADRVWQAARLYKAGKASKIIATGDYAKDTTLPLLKEFGVGEEAVSFLDARTTEEEAKGLWEMLGRSGGVAELGVEEFGESDSPTQKLIHCKAEGLARDECVAYEAGEIDVREVCAGDRGCVRTGRLREYFYGREDATAQDVPSGSECVYAQLCGIS